MSRAVLYFTLAAIPSLTQADHAPVTSWDWFKYLAGAAYQGLLAIKALQSLPPAGPPTPPPAPATP